MCLGCPAFRDAWKSQALWLSLETHQPGFPPLAFSLKGDLLQSDGGATNCSAIVGLTKNIAAPLVLFCYEITPNPQAHIHQNALGEAFYQTAYAIQEAAGNQSFLLLFLGPKSYDTFKPGWLIFTSNEVNAIYPVNSGPYLNRVERSTLRKWSFLCSLSETPMSIINLA